MIHLHDILGKKVDNFAKEIERLTTLFSGTEFYDRWDRNRYTLMMMCDSPFRMSPMRDTAVDIRDFLLQHEHYWKESTCDGLLTYCEVLANILAVSESAIGRSSEAVLLKNQIEDNIFVLLEKLGYEMVEDRAGRLVVSRKDAAVSDVVENLDDRHLALTLLEYNRHSLEGNIDRKRELLNTISLAVEPIIKDKAMRCKCPDVFDDVGFALNMLNIRHNNAEGANEQKVFKAMSQETVEQAYDDLYSLMVVLLKVGQLQEGHARMKVLRDKMDKKKGLHK